jgi:phage terminase small subunit
MIMSKKTLTPKQKIFCEEYIVDWNATRAAKVAGYSEKTAYSIGSENLSKPEIQAYIEEIQKDLQKIAGVSRLSTLRELDKVIDDKDAQHRDKMKALEIRNKMLGFNAPEQTESKNTHSVTGIKPITWADGDSTK